jgi:Protein of unknown function (DUF3800)
MIWTAYLDESGTHDDSPIMLMGGFLGNTEQWGRFNNEWRLLLETSGISYCHGTELVHGKKQFKGWPFHKRRAFQDEANRIMLGYLELGVTAIVRKDDYDAIYKATANPSKLRKDTNFGVLFRGCLWAVLGAVTEDLERARQFTVNFVLEDGAKNSADALRLFDLAKSNIAPKWSHLLGTIKLETKQSPGLQAADLLVYASSRIEQNDHGKPSTTIETSSHIVASGNAIPAFKCLRIPITKDSLKGLASDFLLPPDQWTNMQGR